MEFRIITLVLIKDLCGRSLIVSMVIIIKNHVYDLDRKHFFHKQQTCKKYKQGMPKKVDFCDPKIYCTKNDDHSRGNFMLGIDCAHSRALKMLP